MTKRIFLVGYMCAGKTTIGMALALKLGYRFIDLDQYIEQQQGKSVSAIFAQNGEAYFRKLESQALTDMFLLDNVVVATGGGTPCQGNNMALMNQNGITVFLNPSIDQLVERLEIGKSTRPLLKDKTPTQMRHFVTQMLEQRIPYYTQAQYTCSGHLVTGALEILALLTKNNYLCKN
jgi:shikimate kinase